MGAAGTKIKRARGPHFPSEPKDQKGRKHQKCQTAKGLKCFKRTNELNSLPRKWASDGAGRARRL